MRRFWYYTYMLVTLLGLILAVHTTRSTVMIQLFKLSSTCTSQLPKFAVQDGQLYSITGGETQTILALGRLDIPPSEVTLALAWMRQEGHNTAYFGINNCVTHTAFVELPAMDKAC